MIFYNPKERMTEEKFCLKWNDFEANISSSFKELRSETESCDVLLCPGGGGDQDSQLGAHKLVLSACSAVLRQMLRRGGGGCYRHVIYLRGVSGPDIENLLNFM